jgi:hypothetical protein
MIYSDGNEKSLLDKLLEDKEQDIDDTNDTNDTNNIDDYINEFVKNGGKARKSKTTKVPKRAPKKTTKSSSTKKISTRRKLDLKEVEIEEKDQRLYTLAQGRKDAKETLSKYYKQIELFLKNYQLKKRKNMLTEDDIDELVKTYDDLKANVEDELNLLIDSLSDPPPESFYDFLENGMERQRLRVEKVIN